MTSTADFLEAWANEEKQQKGTGSGSDYVPVPDGISTAVLKAVDGQENDKGKTVVLRYYFPAQNTEESEYVNLLPRTVKAIKAKLLALGQKIPNSGELDAVVGAFRGAVGYTVKVEKKSTRKASGTGFYRDFYVKEVLDKVAAPAGGGNARPIDEDSLPF